MRGAVAPVFCEILALVLALGLLAWRTWDRWGPVPERPVPPGAPVRQWSANTCGPAALATLLSVCHRPWSRAALEQECRVTAAGSSLDDLREACRRRGLRADAVQATNPRGLLRVPRPYLAHLASGHFVVVERAYGGRLEVFDPATGNEHTVTPDDLYRRGRGWALAVAPR